MNDTDRLIIDRLQRGLPLTSHPWQTLAEETGIPEQDVRQRLQDFLDQGLLTRFGPMYDIERLGGAFTLAAMAVPSERFAAITALLGAMPQVAHNYERDHQLNMWFVLACETAEGIGAAIEFIEARTGLPVLNLPKEETFHVGLHLTA